MCSCCRQSCVVETVSLLTNETTVDYFSDQLDTILLSILPLMIVGHHGNHMCWRIIKEVAGSSLSKAHPLLQDLKSVKTSQGTSKCNGHGSINGVLCEVWKLLKKGSKDGDTLCEAHQVLVNNLAKQLVKMDNNRQMSIVCCNITNLFITKLHISQVKLFVEVLKSGDDYLLHFLIVPILGVAIATQISHIKGPSLTSS